MTEAARTFTCFGGVCTEVLHELPVSEGALATSGISKRSWFGPGMRLGHRLLDPATGQPAYTGVVQVTARAPTALEGEALAKAAVLSGPHGATGWLPHGGMIVFDDGSHTVIRRRRVTCYEREARRRRRDIT